MLLYDRSTQRRGGAERRASGLAGEVRAMEEVRMRAVQRLTADEFFAWQALVEGRYELGDGHIVPHPDYVTPVGFAAPVAISTLRPINTGEPLSHKFHTSLRTLLHSRGHSQLYRTLGIGLIIED